MALSNDRQAEEKKVKAMLENQVWLTRPWVKAVRLPVKTTPNRYGV